MLNTSKVLVAVFLMSNLLLSGGLFAQQEYVKKISISQWVEDMETCEDKLYVLDNTEIYYDESQDSIYAFWQQRSEEPSVNDKRMMKKVSSIVLIKNCKLPSNATSQLRHINFQNNVTIAQCQGAMQYIFYNCTFAQGLDIHWCDFGSLELMHCSFQQRIVLNNAQINNLLFGNCSFYTDCKVPNSPYGFGIEKENHSWQYLFNIRQSEKNVKSFNITNCTILPSDVKPVLAFNYGKYDDINFHETDFTNCIIDFTRCSIKECFSVSHCKFTQPLGMFKFNIPDDNTSFNWSQLDSVGIGLYSYYEWAPYIHTTDTLIATIDYYNELNSSYRKFFSMYRNQGDMESANACYKQIKDMETAKYRYLYLQNKNITTWFNWKFNQFLKLFSEYGTNPVQSLIFSMWTLLLFAAVYFFFYSDWDGINRKYLIKKHRQVMQYFRSEQRLEDFYTKTYSEDLKAFDDYKSEMKESRMDIPSFIIFLGKPLYWFSVIRYKLLSFIYRRTELLHGRWIDLKTSRKFFVGTTVFISVMVYLFFLSLVRALNAVVLSVNAFSTLGFGTIPVKGASRYITILEGFLGWFLLSIFSVSLISQMIQN